MSHTNPREHDRTYIHVPGSLGESLADAVANGMGSWRFIIIQTTFVIIWMVLNLVGFMYHWDAYPFILLNLLFSTQAAYAAPIIMMSQNRQAQKDRVRDDQEAGEVHLQAEQMTLLSEVNARQLDILNQQSEILAMLRAKWDV